MSKQVPRINIHAAQDLVASGDAVLICAYDDEDKCRSMAIAHSVTWKEFEERRADLDHRKQIILYCA